MNKNMIIGIVGGVVAVIVMIFVFSGDTPESLLEEAELLSAKCGSTTEEYGSVECHNQANDLGARWERTVDELDIVEQRVWWEKWNQAFTLDIGGPERSGPISEDDWRNLDGQK